MNWQSCKIAGKRIVVLLAHRVLVLWWWFHHPRTRGVKVLVCYQDQVLLVRTSYGDQRWSIPGGGVRAREAPAAAARREIKEELGMTLNELRPLGVYEQVIEYKQDQVTCFQSDVTAPEVYPDGAEVVHAAWYPLHALPAERTPSVDRVLELSRG